MLSVAAANILQLVQTQSTSVEIRESLAALNIGEVRAVLEQICGCTQYHPARS